LIDVTIQKFTSSNDFSNGPMVSNPGSVTVEFNPVLNWTDIEEGTVEYNCSGCMMKTTTGTPTYTIPADQEASLKAATVETLNYGALSTWYKL
jgi:hypothetical protein